MAGLPVPPPTLPDVLTDACARLGADVVCYSFIVEDLHLLLLAGLPTHLCKNFRAFSHEPVSFAFARLGIVIAQSHRLQSRHATTPGGVVGPLFDVLMELAACERRKSCGDPCGARFTDLVTRPYPLTARSFSRRTRLG